MDALEGKVDLYEVAEIKLSYSAKVKASLRPCVCGSRQVYEVLSSIWAGRKIELSLLRISK